MTSRVPNKVRSIEPARAFQDQVYAAPARSLARRTMLSFDGRGSGWFNLPRKCSGLGHVAATIGFLLLSLTGCGGLFGAGDQPLPAVQKKSATPVLSLPRYTQGSWFAFDDGSRNEVVMAAGENVIWEDEKGKWEMRYRNPALPRLRWSSGSAIVLADPTSLWPLQPGKTARFNVLRESRRKNGEVTKRKRIWDCEVDEPTGIQTEAGSFDAYPIICERRSRGRSDKLLRTRTFYYAPAIGHYVQYSTINRQGVAKSRKLVSYHIETSTNAPRH